MITLAKQIGTVAALMLIATQAQATIWTGGLAYDEVSTITSAALGKTYLAFDQTIGMTYQDTLNSVSPSGIYSDYEIATTEDAFAFFREATTNTSIQNVINSSQSIFTNVVGGYNDGDLGDSYNGYNDFAMFIGEKGKIGLLGFYDDLVEDARLWDDWNTVTQAQTFASAQSGTGWLLQKTTPPPAVVPLPGSVWFMGTALLGLVGYSRKNKSQAVAA